MKRLEALDANVGWHDFFEKVDEETFTKYIEEYKKEFGCKNDLVDDWDDFYDFSLRSGKYKRVSWETLHECLIARLYCGLDGIAFFLRKER